MENRPTKYEFVIKNSGEVWQTWKVEVMYSLHNERPKTLSYNIFPSKFEIINVEDFPSDLIKTISIEVYTVTDGTPFSGGYKKKTEKVIITRENGNRWVMTSNPYFSFMNSNNKQVYTSKIITCSLEFSL